nr:M20/M25/M40 family metallo-hydrolase [Planococcus donghaensis]
MTLIEEAAQTISQSIDSKRSTYIKASHEIHDRPEIGNQEFFASTLLISLLEEAGFAVEKGVAGHETAFFARKKSELSGPTIAYLAEYDALPGIGHACGHNIIGTTSVAAAIALSETLDAVGGEVVVLGTPAEEGGPNGSAKGSFVKHGLLEEIDAALMLHPSGNSAITGPSLAVDPLEFHFYGKPAHAAGSPEKGINALDAVLQLFNSIKRIASAIAVRCACSWYYYARWRRPQYYSRVCGCAILHSRRLMEENGGNRS